MAIADLAGEDLSGRSQGSAGSTAGRVRLPIFGTNQKSGRACPSSGSAVNLSETRALQPGGTRSSPDRMSAWICRLPAMTAFTYKLSRLSARGRSATAAGFTLDLPSDRLKRCLPKLSTSAPAPVDFPLSPAKVAPLPGKGNCHHSFWGRLSGKLRHHLSAGRRARRRVSRWRCLKCPFPCPHRPPVPRGPAASWRGRTAGPPR